MNLDYAMSIYKHNKFYTLLLPRMYIYHSTNCPHIRFFDHKNINLNDIPSLRSHRLNRHEL